MAESTVTADAGSGGEDFATDEIGAKHFPVSKLAFGAYNTATLVASGSGLPVSGTFWPGTQPVSGTFYQETQPVSLASVPSHHVTNTGTFATQATLQTGSDAIGKLAANDTVDIGDVTVNNAAGSGIYIRPGTGINLNTSAVTITGALPAGNANIGNVDIVTLPAANLGMRAMAASVSIVPASDITDGTYIGDIKFGEALVAGTALIGKVGIDQTTPGTTNAVAPISGQAGVAGNAGVVGATVQRVTLASDDPAVALLTTMDVDTGKIVTAVEIMDDWDEANRCMVNLIVGQAGVAAGAGAVGVTVPRMTLASNDPAVALLTTIDADTGAIKTALELIDSVGNGAAAAAQRVTIADDSTGVLATVGTVTAVTDITNTVTVQGTVTAQNLSGDVAHDTGDSGNPVKVGAVAVNADPAAVGTGDRVNLIASLVGKLISLPYAIPENTINGQTAALTDTTSTQVIAAQGVGVRVYVTDLIVTNSHATQGTFVTLEDEDGNDHWTGYAREDGGGFTLSFNVPLRLVANKKLHAKCLTAGANVIVSAQGFKGA